MLKPNETNADLKLRFSIDRDRSLRNVENVTWTWGEMVERLTRSHADRLTLAEFKDLSKDQQAKRKNNGYFVGGQFKKNIRHKNLMTERRLITMDVDQGTPEILKGLQRGTSGLGGIEYVVYSTRTHGDGAIKLRVVIPLSKALPHEWFQALSRILAWNLDFRMRAVDVVSFVPTQLMYWPAHCADVKPVFVHNRGSLLDVDRTLFEWGDGDRWKDHSLLPRSERERPLREGSSSKQAPTDKRGIVGAFCRAYSMDEGISAFLSDIYEPSEVGPDGVPTRYTYTPGTTANGVQVYDDGHVQSFHGSDPAGGQNCNVFDLVRLHLFGEKDGTRDLTDVDPREYPSYKAISQFLTEDDGTMRELREDNYGMDPDDLADESFEGAQPEVTSDDDELDDPRPAKATDKDPLADNDLDAVKDWRDDLEISEKGTVKITQNNIVLILRNSPVFKGRFAHNEFTHFDCLRRRLRVKSLRIDYKLSSNTDTLLEDFHFAAVRQIFSAPRGRARTGWGMKVSQADISEAMTIICRENTFHPIREMLEGLLWDGKHRLDKLWTKGLHTPDTAYYRQTARHIMTAAVARIFEPGTKFDFMPVLIGPQGIMKSTFVMHLGYIQWYGETPGYFDDKKKFVEASMGVWFQEIGEMANFRRASDDEAIKSTLSGTEDIVRLSYRRNPQRISRQFVMLGTTNEASFLRDRHRRIWPILCGPGDLDIDWLLANRDQLFAEAVTVYREMRHMTNSERLPLYLRGDAAGEFEVRQEDHRMGTEAEAKSGLIKVWLDRLVPPSMADKVGVEYLDAEDATDDLFEPIGSALRRYTCAQELFEKVFGGDLGKYSQRDAQSIGAAMRHLSDEWQTVPRLQCGKYGRQRGYVRIGDNGELDL